MNPASVSFAATSAATVGRSASVKGLVSSTPHSMPDSRRPPADRLADGGGIRGWSRAAAGPAAPTGPAAERSVRVGSAGAGPVEGRARTSGGDPGRSGVGAVRVR
ncbi:hypothetical protein GCM10020218_106800 [Dactylosporangium vinaceum]